MEGRDRVEELDPASLGRHPVDGRRERLWNDPGLVHGHVDDLRLVCREGTQRADVCRCLGENHISRINEDPRDEVQRLLRANGYHDLVGVRLDALQGHHFADLLAQSHVTLRGAILQGILAARGD